MTEFNAAKSRSKRPCPLWVDAFQRDTQHLQADEVGAYICLLMAMWTRESCDLPDDDMRLARISRVSTRLWKSRVGPAVMEFFTRENGVVFSNRLREEAGYVERQVKQQSDRKKGKKSDKALNNNDQGQTTDTTTDQSGEHPSQQPNNPTIERDNSKLSSLSDAQARDDDLEWIRSDGIRWFVSRGLTETQIEGHIADWLKEYPAKQVRAAIGTATVSAPGSPVRYVAGVLRNGPRSNLQQFPGDRAQLKKQAEREEQERIRARRAALREEG